MLEAFQACQTAINLVGTIYLAVIMLSWLCMLFLYRAKLNWEAAYNAAKLVADHRQETINQLRALLRLNDPIKKVTSAAVERRQTH